MLIGPSKNPPPDAIRQPIKIHPDVREQLGRLLWEPELHGVGYSEFIQRAIDQARIEIHAYRHMQEAHDKIQEKKNDNQN